MVAGAYAPTRLGDKHLRQAFELLSDPKIRAAAQNHGNPEALAEAEAMWARLFADPRQEVVKHFRHKYTAHRGKPRADVPLPKYSEFFEIARDTAALMEKLAHGIGGTTETLASRRNELIRSAQEFWRPWT